MNAGEYRKAIDLAITIATEARGNGEPTSLETQMIVFAGALIGVLGDGDPALASRIRLFTQQSIRATRVVSPGTAA